MAKKTSQSKKTAKAIIDTFTTSIMPPELIRSSLVRRPDNSTDGVKPKNSYDISVEFTSCEGSEYSGLCEISAQRHIGEDEPIMQFDAVYSFYMNITLSSGDNEDFDEFVYSVIVLQIWTLYRSLLASHSSQTIGGLPILPKIPNSASVKWRRMEPDEIEQMTVSEISLSR